VQQVRAQRGGARWRRGHRRQGRLPGAVLGGARLQRGQLAAELVRAEQAGHLAAGQQAVDGLQHACVEDRGEEDVDWGREGG
jgi:hypothetical protein